MKTSSRIFAILFAALTLIAAGAAILGATHQWFIAALCTILSIVLLADSGKKLNQRIFNPLNK